MIPFYKPYTPNKDKILESISSSIDSGVMTNHGPLVDKLEKSLMDYLGVRNLLLVSNGTIALQLAYKALELKGEAITTPFSFLATSSSLLWEGLCLRFCDIDSETFNLDDQLLNKHICPDSSSIIPVHTFGNPCNIEEIDRFAYDYNLKVIYDAAHAFGSSYFDSSIFNYGDISTVSFHATKIFHTVEGGAIIVKDDSLYNRIKSLRAFGQLDRMFGINAKMTEMQAAVGLAVLDKIDYILNVRTYLYDIYKSQLNNVQFQKINPDGQCNYSYFPVVFKDAETLLKVEHELKNHNLPSKRYFHPSLDQLIHKTQHSNSIDISSRILCLPLYTELETDNIFKICDVINKVNQSDS